MYFFLPPVENIFLVVIESCFGITVQIKQLKHSSKYLVRLAEENLKEFSNDMK